jgi:hypothetical protein
MKSVFSFVWLSLALFSCSDNDAKTGTTASTNEQDSIKSFFPVTAYIQGQIFGLKQKGINPIKYITINERTDSSWLKLEELDSAVREFTTPVIDSANMAGFFAEKSFMDQSINAVTLTYEPISALPDSMKLTRWDVYIDPKTQQVKRIYLVKEIDKNRSLQLTWVNNQWCKITTIVTDAAGHAKVEKEEKYFWGF